MSNEKDKKSLIAGNIDLKQGNNSLAIIGNTAPIDLNLNQAIFANDSSSTSKKENNSDSDENTFETDKSSEKSRSGKKEWPDPMQYTIADVWNRKRDGAFCLKTKTEGQRDGKAEFPMGSNQMQLMMLLCHKHPEGILLSEIIDQIYKAEKIDLMKHPESEKAKLLLKKVRSLPSDIRKKLKKSNINPDIITSLGIEADDQEEVSLQVKHVNWLGQEIDG